MDLIDALVAKSILLRSGESSARYRLLDAIGEFGLHKLRGRGNERRLRLRHFRWYTGLAARQEAFGRQCSVPDGSIEERGPDDQR